MRNETANEEKYNVLKKISSTLHRKKKKQVGHITRTRYRKAIARECIASASLLHYAISHPVNDGFKTRPNTVVLRTNPGVNKRNKRISTCNEMTTQRNIDFKERDFKVDSS